MSRELEYRECKDCETPLWDREGSKCTNCVLDEQIKIGMTVGLLMTAGFLTITLVWIFSPTAWTWILAR